MTDAPTLVDQLAVREVGLATFQGFLTEVPMGRAFGGQVLGQALGAGASTAVQFPWPTSMHAYFIGSADSRLPVTYEVESTRDGGRYAWRRVRATQAERVVLDALMCFQREAAPDVAVDLPSCLSAPDTLPSVGEMIDVAGPELDWFFLRHGALAVEGRYPISAPPIRVAGGDRTMQQDVWLRAELPDVMSPAQAGAVLAFFSDVNLMATPLVALGRTGRSEDSGGASFDHQIQFHSSTTTVRDWLFYAQSTDAIAEQTIMASGRIVSPNGKLMLTVRQQGLAR